MKKKPGYIATLMQYVKEHQKDVYSVPEHDCVHFVAGYLLLALEDADELIAKLAEVFTYATDKEMLEVKAKFGGLKHAVTTVLAQDALGPLCARRGDVVYYQPEPNRECLGICTGNNFVVPDSDELSHIPMKLAECCWRIG